jgi:ABC-2 type transport system ATP-binding protein
MKRRLNMAAGLLHDPKLLVLDEPTVGVDPQSRNAIFESVEALSAQGVALLYTTHYMEEAERLCDRVGIIDRGKIIAEGTRRELVERLGQLDRVHVQATGAIDQLITAVRSLEDVAEVTSAESGASILARSGRRLLPRLFEIALTHDVAISSAEVIEPDLEAVFLHLTGKALRD